jgi:predicted RNase H-like HicB family nuclease
MIYLVTLEISEDGKVVAVCPALPGCVSQGRDKKDAIENIQEAITAWMFVENQKLLHAVRTEQTSLHYVLV